MTLIIELGNLRTVYAVYKGDRSDVGRNRIMQGRYDPTKYDKIPPLKQGHDRSTFSLCSMKSTGRTSDKLSANTSAYCSIRCRTLSLWGRDRSGPISILSVISLTRLGLNGFVTRLLRRCGSRCSDSNFQLES